MQNDAYYNMHRTGSSTFGLRYESWRKHYRYSLPLLVILLVLTIFALQILSGGSFMLRTPFSDSDRSEVKQGLSAETSGEVEYSAEMQYGIVIDAGSSGSRVHIFRFFNPIGGKGLPKIQWPAESKKQTPGLSSFADNPELAGETMRPLLDFAAENVPADMQERTPLFVMATAGMRLVDADVVDVILDACRNTLERGKFLFSRDWVSIIPGYKEGVYGWAAANYASGLKAGGNPSSTLGVIELGGASSQVTFASEHPIPHELRRTVSLGGLNFTLYTHSFLGLGQEAAQDALAQTLFKDDTLISKDAVEDPCTPPGFVSGPSPIAVGRLVVGATRKVVARGNFSLCLEAATRLLAPRDDASWHPACARASTNGRLPGGGPAGGNLPCGADGMPTPALKGEFLATENFFYTAEFFALGVRPNLAELKAVGSKYCSMSWDEVLRTHGPESAPGGERTASTGRTETELLKYCFSAAYIVAFLHVGWGVGLQDTAIHFSNSARDIPVDWALGAMLLEVAPFSLPVEHSKEEVDELVYAAEQIEALNQAARSSSEGGDSGVLNTVATLGLIVVCVAVVLRWMTGASFRLFDTKLTKAKPGAKQPGGMRKSGSSMMDSMEKAA